MAQQETHVVTNVSRRHMALPTGDIDNSSLLAAIETLQNDSLDVFFNVHETIEIHVDFKDRQVSTWKNQFLALSRAYHVTGRVKFMAEVVNVVFAVVFYMQLSILKQTNGKVYRGAMKTFLQDHSSASKAQLEEMKRLGRRFFVLIEVFGFGALAFLDCISSRKFIYASNKSFDEFCTRFVLLYCLVYCPENKKA